MEYMSKEGYDKLVAELHQMESVDLPQVRDAIAEARDKGDLSENFEYHAAKREQARLMGRIRFKQRVLANARVLDTSNRNADSVQLLSRVEMTNMGNASRMTYTIASPHEANLREGKISRCASPRARCGSASTASSCRRGAPTVLPSVRINIAKTRQESPQKRRHGPLLANFHDLNLADSNKSRIFAT